MSPVAARNVDLDDIQGIVRYGYRRLPEASFLLLRVRDRSAARQWLAELEVSSAVERDPPPVTAVQVALTAEGLCALGVAKAVIKGFSPEFLTGMAEPNRARRLGDIGDNAPQNWLWGAPSGARMPHLVVLLYAAPGRLVEWQQEISRQCEAGFEQFECLSTTEWDGLEPFGFVDGISEPRLDWERRREVRDREQLDYINRACLGEFLLGYPNEYARYTDRPLLDPAQDAAASELPRAEDAPEHADLGRNGSYLVLRQLSQEVRQFWQHLHREAGGDLSVTTRLAESMVGRTRDGEPLVEISGVSIEGEHGPRNTFTYEGDPDGFRCPISAHIRRANPRNADLPPGPSDWLSRLRRRLGFDPAALPEDLVSSTRFHRLLRRGRKYGVQITPEQAVSGAGPNEPSGLHFICLGANLARQFEFVQSAWLAGTRFQGLNESDPLLGNRASDPNGAPTDMFSMPQATGPDRRLSELPQFVTVVGGAYFFLPGIRALRYLATS